MHQFQQRADEAERKQAGAAAPVGDEAPLRFQP